MGSLQAQFENALGKTDPGFLQEIMDIARGEPQLPGNALG